jgi:hypothetical protein
VRKKKTEDAFNAVDEAAHIKRLLSEADNEWSRIHTRMRTDLRFVGAADQWDNADIILRGENRARQQFPLLDKYVERIVGNYNLNPFSIQIEPLNLFASQTAEQVQGIVNGIEAASETRYAYRQALRNAASTGYGWLSITTDYGEDGKWIEVKIETIEDPCSVIIDPSSRFIDGRDAGWAAVREWIGKKAAERLFGKEFVESACHQSIWNGDSDQKEGAVEVVTFYERVKKGDKEVVRKCRLVGDQIAMNEEQKPRELALKRLPIVPVYGLPVIEKGRLNYISIVHRAIDAQKDINFAVSTGAERLALSPTAKILASVEGIAGMEALYADANRSNRSVLTYRALDESGNPLPTPTKLDPAVNANDISQYYQLYTQAIAECVGIPLDGIGGSTTKQLTAEETLTKARAAETVLSTLYENLAASVRAVGKIMLELIASQYVGDRPVMTTNAGGRTQVQQMNLGEGLDVDALNIRVEAGPLLSTQRKENVRVFLQLYQLAPDPYKSLLFTKIVENSDGMDMATLQACQQIAAQNLDKAQQDAQKLQTLETECQRLKEALNNAQIALAAAKSRSSDASVKAQSQVVAAQIAADAGIKKELIKQQGEDSRAAQNIAARQNEKADELYADMIRSASEQTNAMEEAQRNIQDLLSQEEAAPPPQGGF